MPFKRYITSILSTTVFILLTIVLLQANIIYVKVHRASIEFGYTTGMTIDDSIQATEDALNDPELKDIIADAKKRGFIE